MKTVLLIVASLVALSQAQYRNGDSKNAAILQEARYLSTDGSFGAAYVQDDGSEFKEETDADGTRKGQYSYVDPMGKKITVQYTAGKNGFQVTGDHLPKAPLPVPVPAPQQPQYQSAPRRQNLPVPQYNTNPQYNAIPQQQNGQDDGSYRPGQYDEGQYNPNQYNNNNAQYNNNNNQYNNGQFNQQQFGGFQQQPFQQTTTTTPAPHRFFPPGKLNLNRTPDGYQYSFSQN